MGSVIRSFTSGVRFTKWAGHILEAQICRTASQRVHRWLGGPRGTARGEGGALAEAQHVQEQRVIQEEARAKPQRVWKHKGATVLPDQGQETAFDLMLFTQTISKLIRIALRVKIWPVSEADDPNADVFESSQNNGKR